MTNNEVTVGDLIQSGRMLKDPRARLDDKVYSSVTGKPLEYGTTAPGEIGPDDKVEFTFRKESDYPDIPSQVKDAEIRFILPMAKYLANTLGITVVDETSYSHMTLPLRAGFLFVVLNIRGTRIRDGVASWLGVTVMCKRHPIVTVQFKLNMSTGQIGVYRVKTWERVNSRYVMHGDRSGKFISREEASALILNYLRIESVLPTL